ncbi:RNI-like protein [Gonapodya prolifera JEL478]|uniref:RNI-like protein n=1 Tax=Gonapodya prolifera (strain JEL478) TaxID=1344416 RepID=A0A139A5K3_GONPJ|nr:RNI-like protein [Gonapodya prolifera JEL478]|eukprot:KXS12056.1 RNI-like protein [Gonapodya prolifera JEL478]
MEAFRAAYTQACNKTGIEPLPLVLDSKSPTLNLSGQSLPLKAVSALGDALRDDVVICSINLGDGFLSDDGCIIISNSLKSNKTVKALDLRASNIRVDGATAMGQMLKVVVEAGGFPFFTTLIANLSSLLQVNCTLEKLSLEWNCIGLWDTGVKALADALTVNQTLVDLDLRNNRITPQGAQCIAMSLKHNTALRRLDLRWNNVGLLGGRAFVDALKWNMFLTDLELAGNEVPEDVNRTIFANLERNRERHTKKSAAHANATNLSNTIQNITQQHNDAIGNLTSRLESTEQRYRTLVEKLENANAELKRWQGLHRELEGKMTATESERASCQSTLIAERNENRERISRLQGDLISEREASVRVSEESKSSVRDLSKKILSLEAELAEANMKTDVLKREKRMLMEDLDRAQERERSLLGTYEGKIHDLESQILQKHKDHETELERLRNKLSEDKRRSEDNVVQAVQKCRQEMDNMRKEMEARIQFERSQHESLQSKLDECNLQRANICSEHESQLKRWSREKYEIEDSRAKLAADFKMAQDDNLRLRSQVDNLERTTSTLRQRTHELSAMEEREKTISRAFEEKVNEYEKLKGMLKEKEVEAATLRGVLEDEERTRIQIASLLTKPRGLGNRT